mmetsp:Transcript_15118/g.45293  ORF Transcript_15118/g.45293 Transcript_15118/m.45293 type:complete len:260 (-) Transcript_15118:12-791(-)
MKSRWPKAIGFVDVFKGRTHAKHIDHRRSDTSNTLVHCSSEPCGPGTLRPAQHKELRGYGRSTVGRKHLLHHIHCLHRCFHHRQKSDPFGIKSFHILMPRVGNDVILSSCFLGRIVRKYDWFVRELFYVNHDSTGENSSIDCNRLHRNHDGCLSVVAIIQAQQGKRSIGRLSRDDDMHGVKPQTARNLSAAQPALRGHVEGKAHVLSSFLFLHQIIREGCIRSLHISVEGCLDLVEVRRRCCRNAKVCACACRNTAAEH